MKNAILLKIVMILLFFSVLSAKNPGSSISDIEMDKEAIKKAALDYIEGWYEGNSDRMERALHPELAKRGVFVDKKTGKIIMRSLDAADMIKFTKAGAGKSPEKKEKVMVQILDLFKNTASMKVVSPDFVDYLHLVRYDGGWAIVNVIWEMNQ